MRKDTEYFQLRKYLGSIELTLAYFDFKGDLNIFLFI